MNEWLGEHVPAFSAASMAAYGAVHKMKEPPFSRGTLMEAAHRLCPSKYSDTLHKMTILAAYINGYNQSPCALHA